LDHPLRLKSGWISTSITPNLAMARWPKQPTRQLARKLMARNTDNMVSFQKGASRSEMLIEILIHQLEGLFRFIAAFFFIFIISTSL
jgi:hypothetical protein